MYHKAHGTDRVLEVALREWNNYQKDWKERGYKHPEGKDYVEYPYTKEVVSKWFEDWSQLMGLNISVDGPPAMVLLTRPKNNLHLQRQLKQTHEGIAAVGILLPGTL